MSIKLKTMTTIMNPDDETMQDFMRGINAFLDANNVYEVHINIIPMYTKIIVNAIIRYEGLL